MTGDYVYLHLESVLRVNLCVFSRDQEGCPNEVSAADIRKVGFDSN